MCTLVWSAAVLFCLSPPGLPDVRERTLIAVKPDGVQRRLVGQIIQRFEQRGFKLVGMKMLQVQEKSDMNVFASVHVMCDLFLTVDFSVVKVSEDLLSQHYSELRTKPFYPSLLHYMTSGPVVVMVRRPLSASLLDAPVLHHCFIL